MDRRTLEMVAGVLRHVLTTLGGALVADGTISDEMLTQGVGAIVTLVGVAASVYAKRRVASSG